MKLLEHLRGGHGLAGERALELVSVQVKVHEQRKLGEVVARDLSLEGVVVEKRRAKRRDPRE